VNKRFEDGRAWPRYGVNSQAWGKPTDTGKPCAFARWALPLQGVPGDYLVLVTDAWRDSVGEDGGRGRAWRIRSGQAPIEIKLNGNDVDGTSRLVPCNGGMALIRQGNERHYFPASACDTGTTQIQLNCAPAWATGDRVFFWADPSTGSGIAGTAAPNAMTEYWVKNIAGNKIELYTDSGLTAKLNAWTSAVGRFYVERRSDAPGFYGNGYPTLLMQPDGAGATAFENGFKAATTNVFATALDATNKILTAPNHRLIPGDKVQYVHSGTPTAYFAFPLNDNQVELCANVTDALTGANAQTLAFTAGDYLYKDGASGQPMPPGREGLFTKNNRLIIVNGLNNLGISDPLDPLHFSAFQSTITADGDGELVTTPIEIGDNAVLIPKENRLHILKNFSAGPTGWTRGGVTGEYGFIASLATEAIGKDVWGLSRKGVVSVAQTEQGTFLGVALPMSQDMKNYMDLVDWSEAPNACGKYWNNRYFIALPRKGQSGSVGTPSPTSKTNNMVLVYNFLNQGWEGVWQGDALKVYCFARHLVFGEERLCFVNADGEVCWFGEGFVDATPGGGTGPTAIADSLTTRVYCKPYPGGTAQDPKLWLKGSVVWDTNNPKLTVTAKSPGHGEAEVCIDALEYQATKYNVYGVLPDGSILDYDPNTATEADFDRANRQDYSLTPEEVMIGELDVHQNTTEGLRMRVNDWGVQLVIENQQGSARVQAVSVAYVPSLKLASRQT